MFSAPEQNGGEKTDYDQRKFSLSHKRPDDRLNSIAWPPLYSFACAIF